jgi:hypothetical protein
MRLIAAGLEISSYPATSSADSHSEPICTQFLGSLEAHPKPFVINYRVQQIAVQTDPTRSKKSPSKVSLSPQIPPATLASIHAPPTKFPGASLMSFLPASSTRRRLFKLASLGLAGLLAGLLSGCNDSPDTTVSTPYTHIASESLSSDASSEAQPSHLPPSHLPRSIEATQIPALRHPPSSRSLQYGSVHMASMATARNGRNRS